jgi:hypothetical protein
MKKHSDGEIILENAANVADPFMLGLGLSKEKSTKRISPIVISTIQSLVDLILPPENEDVYMVPWNLTEQMRQRQHTRRKILQIIKEIEELVNNEKF